VRFITNYLLPPPKRTVLANLGIPLATGETVKDEDRIPIVRKAEVDVSLVSQRLGSQRRGSLGPMFRHDYLIWRKKNGWFAYFLLVPFPSL
jgi:hypothetical protein